MRWIKRLQEQLVSRIAYAVRVEVVNDLLSTIGIDALEEIVNKGKENRVKYGHTNYSNLAELYTRILEERRKEIEK